MCFVGSLTNLSPRMPRHLAVDGKALRSGRLHGAALLTQRVQSTNMVECRVSILGITIMIWGSSPHNST